MAAGVWSQAQRDHMYAAAVAALHDGPVTVGDLMRTGIGGRWMARVALEALESEGIARRLRSDTCARYVAWTLADGDATPGDAFERRAYPAMITGRPSPATIEAARKRHGAKLTERVRALLVAYPTLPPEPPPEGPRQEWSVRLSWDAADAICARRGGAGRVRRALAILAHYTWANAQRVAREAAEGAAKGER